MANANKNITLSITINSNTIYRMGRVFHGTDP